MPVRLRIRRLNAWAAFEPPFNHAFRWSRPPYVHPPMNTPRIARWVRCAHLQKRRLGRRCIFYARTGCLPSREYAQASMISAATIIGSDSTWPEVIGRPAIVVSQSGTRNHSVKKRAQP